MTTRRRTATTAATFCLALLVAACGGDDDESTTGTTSTTSTTAPGSTTSSEATSSTTAPSTTTTEPNGSVLEDGRHPVYLVEVNVGERTITFDLIQYLSGQAATDAYHEDNPDDPDGPPNDYYIVNDNPRLRTLPVIDDVPVQLVRLHQDENADLDPGTFEEIPSYTTEQIGEAEPPPDKLGFNPWWLTVEDGRIVAIEEQYVP